MYKLFIAFFLCATLVPAQEISPDQGTAAPPEIPAAVKTSLAALLPDAVDATIKPFGAPQFYSSDLWQYMDGGADVYLNYGLAAMVHREYKGAGLEINADIFDMGQPLNAFGIYAAERSPDYHFIAIGAEGYSGDFVLNFLQDRFYIKFSGFGDPVKAAPVLERLARFVSDRIGADKALPAVLGLFPQQNLVAHSQKYMAQAPLGHDFLAPALQASYSFDGKETLVLFSLARDAQDASHRATLLHGDDMIVFARGPYLVVCVHPPIHPEALIKAIDEQIGHAAMAASERHS